MTTQKIYKKFPRFLLAKKYYQTLFILNDLKIADKEISLVAFSALNGSLSSPPIRNRFISEFQSSEGSVYNMLSHLQKLQILVKDTDHKIRLNPQILPQFSEGLFLQIKLDNIDIIDINEKDRSTT